MVTVLIAIFRYLIVLIMLAYTFECFSVFRYHNEESRKHIYLRQNIWMFLLQICAYLALLMVEENKAILLFYFLQLLIMIAILALYHALYPHANRLILNNMCMLLSIGFIILTRLSHEKVLRQFSIATLTLILSLLIPYLFKTIREYGRLRYVFSLIGIFALSVVLVFSRVINGSKLNVSLFGITFQPSEFVKLTFVFAIAGLLYQSVTLKEIVISAAVAGLHVIILVLSKDLGSAVLYFAVYFAMLYIATGKKLFYLAGFAAGAAGSVAGYYLFAHVRNRVAAWKDPISCIETAGYQVSQSLFAIGTGGWFGMGIGQGAPRTIPVVEADFIFAAICEEFGLIFGICLILICLSCLVMFFNIAMRFHERFYRLLAVGLSVMYGFQVFLTLGGVTRFIPLTGVTLPLVSYGGSSVMVSLVLFSLIQGMYITVRSAPQKSKAEDVNDRKESREVLFLTYAFVAVFLAMIGYLLIFMQFFSRDFINNPYNKRQDLFAQRVVRGDILSRDGEILATTSFDLMGVESREYPYQDLFAHAVGFATHGKTGVESIENFELLTSDINIAKRIRNDLYGIKNPGNKVVTTLNVFLQQVAHASLGDRKGAVIVTDVDTGEILALVSKPDFDPNAIITGWEEINADTENSALLNRATQGLYPPGSTFKIVTALEFMKEHPDTDTYSFDCNGSFAYEGNVINCYHGNKHGTVDFAHSFSKSCNSSFANMSTMLNMRSYTATCRDLLFDKRLPIPYSYKVSPLPIGSTDKTEQLMQIAIGQGRTQITPFHMHLLTSAIANDGVLMDPYVVAGVYTAYDDPLELTKPTAYGRIIDRVRSERMQELMREVVKSGTGTRLKDDTFYTAAGKTGSAEFSKNKQMSHAWFTGYAVYETGKKIAVTVIVEEGGSGGETAVPIAKNVFDAYWSCLTAY